MALRHPLLSPLWPTKLGLGARPCPLGPESPQWQQLQDKEAGSGFRMPGGSVDARPPGGGAAPCTEAPQSPTSSSEAEPRTVGQLQEGAWPVPPTAGGQPPPGHLSRCNLPSGPSDVAPAQRGADWVLSHVLPTRDHAREMFTTESDTQQDCSQRYTEAAVAAGTVSQARWRRMEGRKGERASFVAQDSCAGPSPNPPGRLPTTQALQASRPSSARWQWRRIRICRAPWLSLLLTWAWHHGPVFQIS